MNEAENLLNALPKNLATCGLAIHERLLIAGCISYVKTIYIGYDLDGVMVGALYPHANFIEIALALDENHPSELLIDATHLTWKTLPVAGVMKTPEQLNDILALVDEACERIRSGAHAVERPNEFFMKSRRESSDLGAHRHRK